MDLKQLAECVAEHGRQRYAVKRGFALPLAAGASVAASAQHGYGTYQAAREQLDRAAQEQLAPTTQKQAFRMPVLDNARSTPNFGRGAGSAVGEGVSGGIRSLVESPMAGAAHGIGDVVGKGLDRLFFGREFGEKKDPMHMLGGSALNSFGKGVGEIGVQLLKDIANKAVASAGAMGQNAAREAVLSQLKQEDPILATADDKVLMEAFHTMSRFAPVLSTDKNAVRSFLRQAVMSGSGADFATIKLLADSERAVTGQDRK